MANSVSDVLGSIRNRTPGTGGSGFFRILRIAIVFIVIIVLMPQCFTYV